MKALLPFLFLLVERPTSAQEPGKVFLENTKAFSLFSAAVGDSFLLQIALPGTYKNSEKKYPVIYVLDANRSFGMAKDIVDWLSFGAEIPEAVVVGISYREGWWQKRSRDYTPTKDKTNPWGEWPMAGGAGNFIRFIEAELNPVIERKYRIDKESQTLVGLSFGGLFAQYVLFTRPELFDNYLIVNPALIWNDRYVFGLVKDFQPSSQISKIKVFTAVGLLDEEKIIEPWKDMNEVMGSQSTANFSWLSKAYDNQTHFSLLPSAMADGLKLLLK